MRIRYKVNEVFSELEEFVLRVPRTFDCIGVTIQANGKLIKKVDTTNGTFIIQKFNGIHFFNRLAYRLFRKSKAKKSYCHAISLREKGILTPPPIAWIDYYQWGLLNHSYFINLYYPYKPLSEIIMQLDVNDYSTTRLYSLLAKFAFTLHRLGIYHGSFSLENILVTEEPYGYTFALDDLSRIKFRTVNYRMGLENLTMLKIPENQLCILIQHYALLSGQTMRESMDTFSASKKHLEYLRKIRKAITRYSLTLREKVWAHLFSDIKF